MCRLLAAVVVFSLVPDAAFADDEAPPVVHAQSAKGMYVAPESVPYEGGDVPANASIVSKPNGVLIGTGIGLLGSAYLGSLIYGLATCTAQQECRQGSGYLYIPVIGPFITAATAPTTGGQALAAFDGGLQVVGAALIASGFIWPKKFVMWQDKSAALRVLPYAGQGAGGVNLTLTNL